MSLRVCLRAAFALAVALLCVSPLWFAEAALASGTYMGRPTRPPASVDRARYELGKKVFTGEFTPETTARLSSHDEELADLQSRLPHRARARTDLTELSGRLSDGQLQALRYYLSRRYKVE